MTPARAAKFLTHRMEVLTEQIDRELSRATDNTDRVVQIKRAEIVALSMGVGALMKMSPKYQGEENPEVSS